MNFKSIIIIGFSAISIVACKSTSKIADTKKAPTTQLQKTSYAVGSMIANDLKGNGIDSLDAEYIAKAFRVVFNGDSALQSDSLNKALIEALAKGLQEKKQNEEKAKIDAATKQGKDFLEANKTKEGVVTSPSGLQYKVIKKGIGAFPTSSDKVKVHYEGKLLDGTIFDSSFERGEPIEFGLNQVIRGWTEGMQYINEGGEIELYIPYDLAYGERGAGGSIPPYSTLIFKVQLIQVSKGEPQQQHFPGDGHNH